jgi:hypothetical protein
MYRLFGGSARRTDFSKRNPRLSASRRSNLEFRTYMPRTTFSPNDVYGTSARRQYTRDLFQSRSHINDIGRYERTLPHR